MPSRDCQTRVLQHRSHSSYLSISLTGAPLIRRYFSNQGRGAFGSFYGHQITKESHWRAVHSFLRCPLILLLGRRGPEYRFPVNTILMSGWLIHHYQFAINQNFFSENSGFSTSPSRCSHQYGARFPSLPPVRIRSSSLALLNPTECLHLPYIFLRICEEDWPSCFVQPQGLLGAQ